MRLRSVKFEYIDPESINELDGPRIGLIAQEVEKVFPDWVDTRNDSYKTVTFRGFEALAIEALRELREEKDVQLEQIRAGIRKLQRENDDLRDRLERVETVLLNLNAR